MPTLLPSVLVGLRDGLVGAFSPPQTAPLAAAFGGPANAALAQWAGCSPFLVRALLRVLPELAAAPPPIDHRMSLSHSCPRLLASCPCRPPWRWAAPSALSWQSTGAPRLAPPSPTLPSSASTRPPRQAVWLAAAWLHQESACPLPTRPPCPNLQLNASAPEAAAPALAAAGMSLSLLAAAAWLDASIGGSTVW